MKAKVTCTWLENYQVHLRTDRHAWTVDEPQRLGGDDLGPNPFDLLLGALGACLTVTIYHHASQAKLPLEGLWVDVEGEWRGQGDDQTYHIAARVRVRGDLGPQDLAAIGEIAEQCPIGELLKRAAPIQTEVQKV